MDEASIALVVTSLSVFAVFVGLFIWGLATRQFRDIESPKYRMLGTQAPGAANSGKERVDVGKAGMNDGSPGKDGDHHA